MKEMLTITSELFSDLSGFQTLRKNCESLTNELKTSKQEQFSDWSHDVQSQIDDVQNPLWSVVIVIQLLFSCYGLLESILKL